MVKYAQHGNRGENGGSGAQAQGASGSMGFWKTVLGIARRPFISLPIFGLALIMGGVAYLVSPTHYVSSGYMVLTTPTSGGVVDPSKAAWSTNPLLQFNDGLKTTAAILIQAISTPESLKQLGAGPGGGAKITVNDGSSNSALTSTSSTGPFIFVQVDGTSPAGIRDMVLRTENKIRDDLNQRQRELNAPKATYLLLTDVVTPGEPVAKQTTKWEYGAAAGLLVVLVGFGAVYTAERIGAGKRRLASRQIAAANAGGPPDQLVSAGPLPGEQQQPRTPKNSLADHYWLAGDREPSRPRETPRPAQRWPETVRSQPDPMLAQDETREFPIVFDDDDDLDETSPTRAAKDDEQPEVKPRVRRSLTVLSARSEERKSKPRRTGDSEDEGDDAAPRAG
jgi:hypothetical protein